MFDSPIIDIAIGLSFLYFLLVLITSSLNEMINTFLKTRSKELKFAIMNFLENDWERPIYFAVTTGQDAYLGLQNHFQLEGLAYRLVPIKTVNSNANLSGRVATDIMYENLMEKFEWGNMDKENIYMDENNLRMTTNLRLQFSNLADALINEGDNERAKMTLDKSMTVMPDRTVPYTRVLLPTVEAYYELGEYERANGITDTLFTRYEEELEYFLSLDVEDLVSVSDEMQISNYMLQRMVQLTNTLYPQGEFGSELINRSADLTQQFNAKIKELEEARARRKIEAKF